MSYTTSAINYYRVNANNRAIALSSLGTGTPTEEIAAPLASPGNFSTYTTPGGIPTITGNGSVNFNLFAVNQYLYYTDLISGDYVLVGQIATIAVGGLSLTLTSVVVNLPAAASILSAAYSLITSNESIYMRIATGPINDPPGQRYIPNFGIGNWRLNNPLTGRNNPNQSALERVSGIGIPLSNATAVADVPFTFLTQTQFQLSNNATPTQGATYFRSDADYPSFIWILVTPDNGVSTSLSSQTLYRFTTQENMPSIAISPNTTATALTAAVYNNLSTSTGGGSGPGSGS
jgi:hypothetical protein